MIKIYTLNDPDTLEIKYVGKTIQSLKKRLSAHITKSKYNRSTHISCWIYKLLNNNKKPIIQLLEECSNENWIEREKYWICFYKNIIYNHSIGGESGALGYKCTKEHKNKISKSLKGRKRSLEERQNISRGLLGKKLSNETKNKLRNINLGKKYSLESRIKKSKFPILQIDLNNQIINEFPTLGIAEEETGFNKSGMSAVCTGKLKTYKGFMWKYKK